MATSSTFFNVIGPSMINAHKSPIQQAYPTSMLANQAHRRIQPQTQGGPSADVVAVTNLTQNAGFAKLRKSLSCPPLDSPDIPNGVADGEPVVGLRLLLSQRQYSAPNNIVSRYPDTLSVSVTSRRPRRPLRQPEVNADRSGRFFKIANIIQDAARYLRNADPTISQNRIFRSTAPLILFLYFLAAGVAIPRYMRHNETAPSINVHGTSGLARPVNLPFNFPRQTPDSGSPHGTSAHLVTLSDTSPATAAFLFLGGIVTTLIALRLLVWVFAAVTVWLCEMDLSATRKHWSSGGLMAVDNSVEDGRKTALGVRDMILGGIL